MISLKILEKLVKLATKDFGPSVKDLEKKGISINQIKQDLEVLNILDYRAVNIELFKEVMYDYKNNDEKALYVYNFCEHEYRQLTMEELIKIKKFLLTNYKERVKELVGDNHD